MLLVDGSSYLYRAFHAMPDLRAPDGFPTGAIHGFVAMMNWLRERYPAEHAVCVFDAKGRTFRDDWYPEYKAHRAPMPEPLAQQIAPIHEVVRLLGWPVLEVPNIEADDAIGTLARVAAASGHKVIISTGDKDLAQLVTADVTLINTMARPPEVLTVEGVKAKFGVLPERIVDYLTLIGDSVDNVPGVDKVGPKTAVKWIADFGSLDGVVAAADNIKGAVGDNLRKALDWLPTGRKLITVVTDCDLADHVQGWPLLDALALRAVDREGLLDFYKRYGFKTWREELEESFSTAALPAADMPGAACAAEPVPLARNYETITTWDRFGVWLDMLLTAELVAIDTETDSLDPMRAQIVGISFAVEPGRAAYVPLAHRYPGVAEQLPCAEVLARLQPWLEDASHAKVGQNIKYDLHVLENAGIRVRGYRHDTLLQSYVLEAHQKHGLESLAERHLGRKGLSYEEMCGKGANQISFAQVDITRAAQYSGEDSEMTLQVHQTLWPQVQADAGLQFVYAQIEMPASSVLQHIERTGVLIDSAVLARMTSGMSPADIANTVNKAASSAAETGASSVTAEHLLRAIETHQLGGEVSPIKDLLCADTRQRLAYHEAGHALVGHWLGAGVVERVTIEPRGQALGVTYMTRDSEDPLYRQGELSSRLAMMLGGREAELLVQGSVSSGASDDLKRASELAIKMVGSLGFSKSFGLLSVAGVPAELLGPDIQAAVLHEARALLEEAQRKSQSLLARNRCQLDAMAQRLLECEVLGGAELRALLDAKFEPLESDLLAFEPLPA